MRIILKGISSAELSSSTFITGFRTLGEVGYLAPRYIVLKRNMKRIGFITTKYLRDVTFLDEYGIATPFDLFYDKEKKVIVLLNHILPYQKEWNSFARDITRWINAMHIQNVLLIGGLDKRYRQGTEPLKWFKTSSSKIELQYPTLEKQLIVVGPLALFVIHSEVNDVPATTILPYADKDRIDPAAAAEAVNALNQLLDLQIDASELYEDARKLEEELKKQLESIQKEMERLGTDRHYM
ncbi:MULTISPECIES: proteasome assembly chaperone family protein [Acidianus]|uniref:Carboxylate--amine ligase n=1 Tax=Candidatus Acidianus copahuensis TaxID=1160895 RepID=A0A031LME5_9CREN|nr:MULTISPECIES: PAC2 family protein [Acidianus]EZQ03035.1 carboxylate--amine ligase [Candidatus Acidianus copahuensis]NON62360.1 proteasome assembly chaperone family protein [Acidianus sp. RZ1]